MRVLTYVLQWALRRPFLLQHERNTQACSLQNPELHVVYRFVCGLFSAEHLTAECVVVTLIFVERLLDYRNMDLCPTNWRRILVGSALLAYEYWNKQAVWSMDYCQVINNIITAEDMNEIEMHFLHSIRFDIKITSYTYARYYFDLLDMAEANNVVDLFEPFLQSRTLNPEAISRCYQEKDLGRAAIKRSLSADNLLAQATHQIHAL
ncbi:cyclin-Y-like protein 1 [Pipistrellus kuhlii]|uniref:cyclin-Y-like protein 1 n=1 Tax=Pipistrellus kuhlii TaxID=59472 RepID=UPI001E2747E8|nr:cyclin-Y-like protein 1 [Pipistrellus kuhlii]